MNKAWSWAVGGAAIALAWAAWHWLSAEPLAPTAPAPTASALGESQLAVPQPEPAASIAPVPLPAPLVPPSTPQVEQVAGIGSEGFGPHVQRALDSGDPRQALDAARWIASCQPDMDVESMINGTHPKYRLILTPEVRAEVITKERQTQRLCQTLTPDLMAQHKALALRALDAKVPGAGLAYYKSLDRENRSPAEGTRALQGLRADVERGQELAVPVLALGELGQSRVEQLAYQKLLNLLVLKDILPPTAGGLLPPKPPEPPYSIAEQSEAAALVSRLWPRFKRPG
jgi:hypothetical protein